MHARDLLVPLVLAGLAAGCRSHGESGRDSAEGPGSSAMGEAPAGSLLAEVVEADGKAATITLRTLSASGAGASSGIRRIPARGQARSRLASLEAGDQVVVGCEEPAGSAPMASSARSASGPGGGDMGVGASGGESLSACAAVTSITVVGGAGRGR
jgi:hypothetical protein